MIEVLQAERSILRNELAELKNCQVRYFSISVTSTGLLIAAGFHLAKKGYSPAFFLAPLLILVPCWLIFFDKATTITRIVGYSRILEEMISSMATSQAGLRYRYIGWENSLALFRMVQQKNQQLGGKKRRFLEFLRDFKTGFVQVVTFRAAHRYWTINWYTFFGLSVLCWALGSGIWHAEKLNRGLSLILGFFAVVIFFSALHTLCLVGSLNKGKYSYGSNEATWQKVLNLK